MTEAAELLRKCRLLVAIKHKCLRAEAGYSRLMPLMKCSDPGAAGRMLDREIDEAQADVVRRIFRLCPEGEGMKGIANTTSTS